MQMANPPLQICMEPSDWLKGIARGVDGGMDSQTPPSGELIPCSKPQVLERRLRPQHDQALKCPRCDSTHTKFCYYNNYSLSQPRYFCKTCRRYWTKGGSLSNVPVGGGCRKNKRSGARNKLLPEPHRTPASTAVSTFQDATDLHLSFSGVQLPLLSSLMTAETTRNLNFMDCKYNPALECPADGPLHHLADSKFGAAIGLGDAAHGFMSTAGASFLQPGGTSSMGFSVDGSHAELMEAACQRFAIPFEENEEPGSVVDTKSADRILSLQWQDQCCADAAGRESLGYVSSGLGSWAGVINGHGHSAAI